MENTNEMVTYGKGINTIQRPKNMPKYFHPDDHRKIRLRVLKRRLQEIEDFAWSLIPKDLKDPSEYDHGDDAFSGMALINELNDLYNALDDNDTLLATSIALTIGCAHKRIALAQELDGLVETGQKFHTKNKRANDFKKLQAKKNQALFQSMADAIRQRHPDWSKTSIARQIHKELKKDGFAQSISVNTIRQKIKLS